MALKYSVVLVAMASGGGDVWKNPGEVLETIARLGYDGIDIDCEPDSIDPKKFEEVSELATSLGLKIPAIVAAWGGWHAGEERDLASTKEEVRTHAVNYARKCIDESAKMGRPVLEIALAPLHPEYPVCSTPLDVVRRNFERSAAKIAAYATERQVPVAIEAINRYEGYAGYMNSSLEALALAEKIQSDYLGVLVDFFHANIEDGLIPDLLKRVGKRLSYVHLADSNRQAPGTGHIDFAQVITALHDLGYQGYLSVDCCPPVPDWKTLLERSMNYMKKMEKEVLEGKPAASRASSQH